MTNITNNTDVFMVFLLPRIDNFIVTIQSPNSAALGNNLNDAISIDWLPERFCY
jgi:hypothetical protein